MHIVRSAPHRPAVENRQHSASRTCQHSHRLPLRQSSAEHFDSSCITPFFHLLVCPARTPILRMALRLQQPASEPAHG